MPNSHPKLYLLEPQYNSVKSSDKTSVIIVKVRSF